MKHTPTHPPAEASILTACVLCGEAPDAVGVWELPGGTQAIAYRLCDRLAQEGVLHDTEDGVVRVSMLHYNTLDEIEGLIKCLEGLL